MALALANDLPTAGTGLLDQGISDKQYNLSWSPISTINVGESIFIATVTIENDHPQNKEIALYAEGYDEAGKQVAWTYDKANITGQVVKHVEKGETGQFILHLNLAKNIKTISIFANNYDVTPP